MGPILFLVYINDLPDHIKHCTVRLFADDCMLEKEVVSELYYVKLQEDVDRVSMWEKTWLMKYNPTKCEVMSVPASTKAIPP